MQRIHNVYPTAAILPRSDEAVLINMTLFVIGAIASRS